MAYKITDECISCGACEAECQNQAISEGETTYVIDPDKCTECVGNFESPKCVEICPVECCESDPDHVESREQLLDKWRNLHPGETPAEGTY
ncbi:MAG: YfhL family 4Fe-4S dicluster ferredoxin [Chloroflexi bacterium]|nr:YfhL family 4Fe-4S dicluster ferredoxin [Chloroflexota bacterium]